jgi:hypothetical protein
LEHFLRITVMLLRTRREARLGCLLDLPLRRCSGNVGSRKWGLIMRIWRDGVAIRKKRSLGCSLEKLRNNESCLYTHTSQITTFLGIYSQVWGWEKNLNVASAVKRIRPERG